MRRTPDPLIREKIMGGDIMGFVAIVAFLFMQWS